MNKQTPVRVAVYYRGQFIFAKITFNDGTMDVFGNRSFEATGDDVPTAVYHAAKYAFERIHPKKE